MGKIIAVANQKGGVGKTTTAINLSAALAEEGKKILVVDIDPQGNCTSGFGIDKNGQENTVYELLLDDCTINECIIRGIMEGIDLIASNINLAASEIELIGIPRKEFILRDALDYVRDDYDYIIMDCPPSLNTLTVNAMVAADSVIVPIQCEYYALEGLSQLIHTINLVKERLNRKFLRCSMPGQIFPRRSWKMSRSMLNSIFMKLLFREISDLQRRQATGSRSQYMIKNLQVRRHTELWPRK